MYVCVVRVGKIADRIKVVDLVLLMVLAMRGETRRYVQRERNLQTHLLHQPELLRAQGHHRPRPQSCGVLTHDDAARRNEQPRSAYF